jgi:homoserine/homoserine lactone efflux protein
MFDGIPKAVNWDLLVLFIVTETLLCLTPGPAVLLILSQALGGGVRVSFGASLGILAGNTLYFLLSATSVGALLVASPTVFMMLKWLGAAYLIWLGIGAFRGTSPAFSVRADAGASRSMLRRVWQGFLVQTTNPKALLFFTALLPQFIDPALPVAFQVAVLGLASIVIEFCVLIGYGVLAGRASRIATRPRFAALTGRLSGGALIAAGCGVALLKGN